MKQVVFPKRKESFYLFNLFLKHIHDSTHLNYTQTSKKDNSLTIEDAFNNTNFNIHIEKIRECPGIFVAYTTSKNETWRDISGVPIA